MAGSDPVDGLSSTSPLDYGRLYDYRLRSVPQSQRQAVWNEIAKHIHLAMGAPRRILDPAAGRCEFVNAINDVEERWIVDAVDYGAPFRHPGVHAVIADIFHAELPEAHFDGIFVSNFLEHLDGPDQIATFLMKMRVCATVGGRIAVLGPNFRHASREYFDCADHKVALTEVAVEEHLYAAGWEVCSVVPRFIPYSFRSRLPASAPMTRAYLRMPPLWRILGKQFLVLARRPDLT